jgi:membrane protein required for colicin V production
MSLSTLDWVIVLIVLFSVLQALSHGFFREFCAFVGVIAGFLIAAWEYPRLVVWYARFMKSPWPAEIAAFFTIFLLVAMLAGAAGNALGRLVQSVGLRWFDRLLGAVFGFFQGVLVSVVVVLALAALAPQWGVAQSRFAPFMLSAGRALVWAAPSDFRQRFWDGWKLLRELPNHLPGQAGGVHSSEHASTP